jgi:hypothetical protein
VVTPGRRAPASEEVGQGAALLFLACHLFGEDVAVDVRVDGGKDQALELVGFEGFDFPLDGVVDVKAVAAGEGRPSRIVTLARGRGQGVPLDLVVGEKDAGDLAPASGALHPVGSMSEPEASKSPRFLRDAASVRFESTQLRSRRRDHSRCSTCGARWR